MATETLIFMPNGDVTLSLTRYIFKEDEDPSRKQIDLSKPPGQKAPHESGLLDSVTDVEAELEALAAEDDESVLFFAPDAPEIPDGPTSPPPPRARRGSNASSRRDRSESPPASFWATLKRQAARVAEPERSPTPPPTKKAERIVLSSHEVHCVVSSRHLMLASRYFLTILSGDFPQAITLRSQGHVKIELQDDLESMIILLNVIHGAGRKVPRQVSLDDLSKLAVLVSKFEMLSTVEFFSDTWIDNLQRGGLPRSYNENVLPLVFVFWVFDRPEEFRDMTRLAQQESTETLEEDLGEMPILHDIIDAIKRDREFAIETAITVVQALIDRYMAGQAICDSALDDELRYACDSMVLGCLMTSSRKIGIWPKPVAPFNGKKFKDLVKAIRGIRILDVCNKTSSRRWNSHGPSPNCHGLEDSIEASMKSIEAGLDGLQLEDYPKLSEDFSLALQVSLPPAPVEEAKKQPIANNDENLVVYVKDENPPPPPPVEEIKIDQQESTAPSPPFSPRIDSSKITEFPRQEISRPSPQVSPQLDSPRRAESPKPEVEGGSSFFSQRVGFPKPESVKSEVSAPSPRFSQPVEVHNPVKTARPEVVAPQPRSPPYQYPPIAISPKQEFPAANYFSPQPEAQKTTNSPPIQAPTPRYSPVVSSPKVIESMVLVPSPPTLPSTNPFRTAESPKQEFSAPSPRFPPQVSAPRPAPSPKLQSPVNGFGASLKEEARKRSRERDESAQEGVKVSPSPVMGNYSPSKEVQQSRVPVNPRGGSQKIDNGDEDMKRHSTNSPPPNTLNQHQSQKFRVLAKERGSDSEREEVQRAPSVISNLSIDEMLMDIPSQILQSQKVKEGRGSVGEVKPVERSNGNSNGNGIMKETPNTSATTTETEESWIPTKAFKMKKSKKTFSTRY